MLCIYASKALLFGLRSHNGFRRQLWIRQSRRLPSGLASLHVREGFCAQLAKLCMTKPSVLPPTHFPAHAPTHLGRCVTTHPDSAVSTPHLHISKCSCKGSAACSYTCPHVCKRMHTQARTHAHTHTSAHRPKGAAPALPAHAFVRAALLALSRIHALSQACCTHPGSAVALGSVRAARSHLSTAASSSSLSSLVRTVPAPEAADIRLPPE